MIRDPKLRAAVAAAFEAWRRRRDQETGQLAIPYPTPERRNDG